MPTHIFDYFTDQGLYFSRDIITRYVLSLRSKPFVILTGISGTGKTKIAQVFADYICQALPENERSEHIAFVSVRPDWMDNRGLLGYYNPLTERYHATPVLKLLLHAQANSDKAHFIILDEMNLAKVEYYFSDFLSILESRTKNTPEGEALHLHEGAGDVLAQGDTDLKVPASLTIPQNVYFTGTVNVDETTYMFSPKVLDRAHVMEFNTIDLNSYAGKPPMDGDNQEFALNNPQEVIDLFKQEIQFCSMNDFNEINRDNPNLVNYIQALLTILEPYHLHFGYRVINELSRFLLLSKENLANFKEAQALDIALLQKVLPKLHGTRAKLEKPLKEILKFCIDNKFSASEKKCERMLNTLNEQGYTSFIE